MFGWRREMQVLLYVSAVVVGVIAGTLAHSALIAALAFALTWHAPGRWPK